MGRVNLLPVLLFLSVFQIGSAGAQAGSAPAYVPVHGYLTDESGVPLDGPVMLTLSLYGRREDDASDVAGSAPFHTEQQTVEVSQGEFIAYLGDGAPLDLTEFASKNEGEVFLGLQVGTDSELMPRLQFGSAPFSGFAQHCGDAQTLGGSTLDEIQSSLSPASAGPVVASRAASGALVLSSSASAPSAWTPVDRHSVTCPAAGTVIAHGYVRIDAESSSADTTMVVGLRLIEGGVTGNDINSRFLTLEEGAVTSWSSMATFECAAGQTQTVDLQGRVESKGNDDEAEFSASWMVLQFVATPFSQREITLPR